MNAIESRVQSLAGGRTLKVHLCRGGSALGYDEVIALWRADAGFRSLFTETLCNAPFEAYFWETPPVSKGNLDREFEFVLVDAPPLAGVRADSNSFRNQFLTAGDDDVAVFGNLSGDARLITPCPRGEDDVYPHLAAFARNAPDGQQQRLWQRVGEVLTAAVGPEPTWLSTSGLGVFWVHIRLDRRPKYYTFAPYRRFLEADL